MKALAALLLLAQTSAYAFTLNNSANLVFNKDKVAVNVASGFCSNIGIDEAELLSIVRDAVNDYWNKAPTSRLKMNAGSLQTVSGNIQTGTICLPATSCDPNPALAVSSDILVACNNNASNFSGGGVLAVTVPNNISGKNIIGSLILINDQSPNPFVTKSRDEKVAIIAHEIGHAFGLGHSPVNDSLMYYATVPKRRSLGSDDIDGISYLYPKQQPVSCGTVDMSSGGKNNPNTWLGLLMGFFVVGLSLKTYERYLKLRPRF